MSLPDVATLRLCSMLASTSFGFVFVVLWLRNRSAVHFAIWGGSSLLYAAGMLLFALNPAGSLPFFTLLYAALALSNALALAGVRAMEGVRPFSSWMAIPIVFAAAGHAVPAWFAQAGWTDHRPLWQTVGDAAGLSIGIGVPGAILAFGVGASASIGRRMAGLAMLGYLPGYVLSIAGQFLVLPGMELVALLAMLSDQILLGVLNLGLLAIPVEQVQRQLRELALRDALTGCWNRAGLAMLAPSYLRSGSAVVAIDVDHFKRINDQYGHAAGDDVLALIGRETQDLATAFHGRAVRLGGDEFVILLPALSDGPSAFVTMLQNRLGAASGLGMDWSVSAGTAIFHQADTSLNETIARADAALYKAKASRGNVQSGGDVVFFPLGGQNRAAASNASR